MTEPQIFELLNPSKQVDTTRHLEEIKQKIEEITEQTKLAKAFPVALLDSQKLESIILSTAEAYQAALETVISELKHTKNPQLEEAMLVFRQSEDKFQQVLDSIVDIAFFVRKLDANADLERQVLERINAELG